ncbi:MAG: hypothetical protein EXR63_01375 [Dehalococcoidia bacterium]|nr:hypothetical protein [Dehalococcoidia bacterium]
MSTEPPAWPQDFDEDARQHLYDEARLRLSELIAFSDRQEARALALLGLATGFIGAAGIFGDMRVASSVVGVLTSLAVTSYLATAGCAVVVLWPREYESGIDVTWMSRWRGAGRDQLRDAGLEVLVEGFAKNQRIGERRGRWLSWVLRGLIIEALLVVTAQLALPA